MKRVMLLLLAAAGCAGRPAQPVSPAPRPVFVFVHGAWGGAWDWRTVDSLLTLAGHRVVRAQLTGLGERVHLASPDIGLATHIHDVVNIIRWENLRDVVLVGHSYGGMVVSAVADRVPERIRRLIYVDAFVPDSGETGAQLMGMVGGSFVRDHVRGGFVIPPWVRDTTVIPRDVPQPWRTLTDTLHLVNAAARALPATYILTVDRGATVDPFDRFAARASARGWTLVRMTADHVPERSAPAELVALLRREP